MNVIIGTADRISRQAMRPFFESLRQTGYAGDVVMFTRGLAVDTRDFLALHNVKQVPFRRYHPAGIRYIRQAMTRTCKQLHSLSMLSSRAWDNLICAAWHCQASRYFMYDSFLASDQGQYDRVMLTDVRDVFFQDDPFRYDSPASLEVFQEHDGATIKSEPFNRRWIETLFGPAELDRIGNNPIICSGVTMGTVTGMRRYLDSMKTLLREHHEPNGYDQGIHNYLIYNDLLTEVSINRFGAGPVMHVGIAVDDSLHLDSYNRVLDCEGNVVPTIHQYDRHSWLEERMLSNLKAA
jgi:hypothetical protein